MPKRVEVVKFRNERVRDGGSPESSGPAEFGSGVERPSGELPAVEDSGVSSKGRRARGRSSGGDSADMVCRVLMCRYGVGGCTCCFQDLVGLVVRAWYMSM